MVSAQPIGYNTSTGMFEAVVKPNNYRETGNAKIRQFDNLYDARKFVYNVNHSRVPERSGRFYVYNTGFAPADPTADKRPAFLRKWLPSDGCDMPEQGGIGGNIGRSAPPFVCYLA